MPIEPEVFDSGREALGQSIRTKIEPEPLIIVMMLRYGPWARYSIVSGQSSAVTKRASESG